MARLVFGSEDLKRLIFSFGYPEHREFTASLTESLAVDPYPFEDRFLENQQDRCLYDYLVEEYTPQELILWSNYFARCRCCTRHSHDKPRFVNQEIVFTKRSPTKVYECECTCRHYARMCVKAFSHE
jgi:hypothetical protein